MNTFLALSVLGLSAAAGQCVTKSSNQSLSGTPSVGTNRTCIFPAKYYPGGGTTQLTMTTCISTGYTVPWCYVEVNSTTGIAVSGVWGECTSGCDCLTKVNSTSSPLNTTPATYGGLGCIFPAKYYPGGGTTQVTMTECTSSNYHAPWCYTEVDASGNAVSGKWGECISACTPTTTTTPSNTTSNATTTTAGATGTTSGASALLGMGALSTIILMTALHFMA